MQTLPALTPEQRARMNRVDHVRMLQRFNGIRNDYEMRYGKDIRRSPYDDWEYEQELPDKRELTVHRVIPHFAGAQYQTLVYWTYAGQEGPGFFTMAVSKALHLHLLGHAYGWGLPARLLCMRVAGGEYAVSVGAVEQGESL